MKIELQKQVKKHQAGGNVTPVDNAAAIQAAPEQEQDPMAILYQMSAQAIQTQNCEMAMQVCSALIEIIQQMQAPQQTQGEPVFRKGGILVRRIKK